MSEKEYYSRMKKLDCRQKTDRTSKEEDFYIEHQRNYLSKQYIKTLEQENKQLKEKLEDKIDLYEGDTISYQLGYDSAKAFYEKILTEIEEWLKEIMKIYEKDVFDIVSNAIYNQCEDTLDKIQELKEKYK